jgi:hypothetical protein
MQNGGAESDSPTKVWSLTAKLVVSLATSRILVRKSKKKNKAAQSGLKISDASPSAEQDAI